MTKILTISISETIEITDITKRIEELDKYQNWIVASIKELNFKKKMKN